VIHEHQITTDQLAERVQEEPSVGRNREPSLHYASAELYTSFNPRNVLMKIVHHSVCGDVGALGATSTI
jgi:hypothetical protein